MPTVSQALGPGPWGRNGLQDAAGTDSGSSLGEADTGSGWEPVMPDCPAEKRNWE